MFVGGSQCGFRYGLMTIVSVWPLFAVVLIGIVPFAAVLNAWLTRKITPEHTVLAWLALALCATIALAVYANMPFPYAPAVFTGGSGMCALPDF